LTIFFFFGATVVLLTFGAIAGLTTGFVIFGIYTFGTFGTFGTVTLAATTGALFTGFTTGIGWVTYYFFFTGLVLFVVVLFGTEGVLIVLLSTAYSSSY